MGRFSTLNPYKEIELGSNVLDGEKHIVLLQIRKASLKGVVDGRTIFEIKTDFKDIAFRKWGQGNAAKDWFRFTDNTFLGLGCGDGVCIFYSVEIIEINGKGNRLRQ